MNATAEAISGELVIPEHDRTLFRHADADAELQAAQRVAAALKTVLDQGGMTMKIGRSEHVLIDGWQTLGSMLGVSPHVVWSRPLENGAGWEARAEARTVDGRVVGSAEAMVTRDERNWKNADEFALRSMAQTRAMSKALRGPLGFVITLAGRNATPAEEMATDAPTTADAALPEWAQDIPEGAVDRFGDNLAAIVAAAGVTLNPELVAMAVGDKLVKYTDGVIPAACALLAKQLIDAIDKTGPVPDLDAPDGDTPAAAAPDIPEEGTP